jgi:outer membrane immunogenic protein
MHRLVGLGVAGALLAAAAAAVPAFAADLPSVAPPARAPVVAPRYSWYGFYVGLQAGYGWSGSAIEYSPNAAYAVPFAAGAVPGPVAADPKGFVGGITYGSNWQFGGFVVGTESDFSFSAVKRRETLGPLGGFTVQVTGEQKLKYFSTTRARAGFVIGEHLLVFGTGGLASGGVEGSSSFNFVAPGLCAGVGNCPIGSRSKTLWGWAAGGGIEYAHGPWSVKLDYLHYDLGTLKYNVVDPTLPAGVIAASTRFSGDLVRGGINYRFNWTLWDLAFGRR